jgi:hypothetical protein
MVADLSVRAGAVAEVERVENLLQTPRTRRSKGSSPKGGAPTRRRRPSRRVNAEARPPVPAAEPSPSELAAKGEGRRAAPLGSSDPESDGGADTVPVSPEPEPGEDVGT